MVAAAPQEMLDPVLSLRGEMDAAASPVDPEVLPGSESRDHRLDPVGVDVGARGSAGDDQGNASFVDEDGIRLVHDGGVEAALDDVLPPVAELVAEEVETQP
jgi:hypothetical protein